MPWCFVAHSTPACAVKRLVAPLHKFSLPVQLCIPTFMRAYSYSCGCLLHYVLYVDTDYRLARVSLEQSAMLCEERAKCSTQLESPSMGRVPASNSPPVWRQVERWQSGCPRPTPLVRATVPWKPWRLSRSGCSKDLVQDDFGETKVATFRANSLAISFQPQDENSKPSNHGFPS